MFRLLIPAFFLLISCKPYPRIKNISGETIALSHSENPGSDTLYNYLIKPYRDSLDLQMKEVLGISDQAMTKGNPESVLGNFVADLVLYQTGKYLEKKGKPPVDMVLLNNGGLRAPLPAGEITREMVFKLMPFENELVVLTMTGEKTREMLEYIAAIDGMPVAGLKMGIKNKKPSGVMINGEPLNTGKNYRIVTSDYLAAGGDKMKFFNNPVATDTVHMLLRDAIIYYIQEKNREGKTLTAKTDGRIYHE
jgi:2',3'-cyclic-nucleotide 2'-phosphodiesterase (5'-nucleotidase family)